MREGGKEGVCEDGKKEGRRDEVGGVGCVLYG